MDRVIGLFGGPERDDYDGLWSRCDGHELDDGGGIILMWKATNQIDCK